MKYLFAILFYLCSLGRLTAQPGALDVSFDPGIGSDNWVYSIATQADGKILIGGFLTSFAGTARNYFARLNANGTLDISFNLETGFNNAVYSIAV